MTFKQLLETWACYLEDKIYFKVGYPKILPIALEILLNQKLRFYSSTISDQYIFCITYNPYSLDYFSATQELLKSLVTNNNIQLQSE